MLYNLYKLYAKEETSVKYIKLLIALMASCLRSETKAALHKPFSLKMGSLFENRSGLYLTGAFIELCVRVWE